MNGTPITYNGYNLQTATIITNTIDHESIANKNVSFMALAHSNRGSISYVDYPSRTINVTGRILADSGNVATSIASLDGYIDTFKGYLTGQDKNLDIGYAGNTRRYIATVNALTITRPGGLNYATFNISFICTVPFGQSTNSTNALSTAGFNLLTNPSFETDTVGWFTLNSAALTRVTTQFYSGTASAQVVATATSQGIASGYWAINSGNPYTFSAYVKTTSSVQWTIQLDVFDNANTYLRTAYANVTATGGWDRGIVTTTLSGSEAKVNVIVSANQAATLYVDAALLEQSSTASVYSSPVARTAASYSDTVNMIGTAPYQLPVITVTYTALTGGTSKSVSIGNNANGQQITVTRTWVVNDVLVIDVPNKQVLVNGIITDFIGAFPELPPGSQSIGYTDGFTTRTFNYGITYNALYM